MVGTLYHPVGTSRCNSSNQLRTTCRHGFPDGAGRMFALRTLIVAVTVGPYSRTQESAKQGSDGKSKHPAEEDDEQNAGTTVRPQRTLGNTAGYSRTENRTDQAPNRNWGTAAGLALRFRGLRQDNLLVLQRSRAVAALTLVGPGGCLARRAESKTYLRHRVTSSGWSNSPNRRTCPTSASTVEPAALAAPPPAPPPPWSPPSSRPFGLLPRRHQPKPCSTE